MPTRRGTWLTVAGRSARAAGVLLLLFVVYALFGSALLEGHAQSSLNRATHLRLTSADVGLDSLVMSSDNAAALEHGPGLTPGSGRPGTSQPIVIVGHRVAAGAPFRHLTALKPGSVVVLRTGNGPVFTYDVERVLSVGPPATIVEPSGSQALVLVSATPLYHESRWVIVVARLRNGGPQSAGPVTVRLPRLGVSSTGLMVGALLLVCTSLIWGMRSLWRRRVWWLRLLAWLPIAMLAWLSWQVMLRSLSPVL